MEDLIKIAKLKTRHIIGLVSGMSMDGVDASHVKFEGSGAQTKFEILGHRKEPYPAELCASLVELSRGGPCTLESLCRLNFAVAEVFSRAVMELKKAAPLTQRTIHAIGSHGQTIWHALKPRENSNLSAASTLQIGEPSLIAQRTEVVTIGDFRTADMAAGGQGAPLSAYGDWVLFHKPDKNIAVLQIGGISNATILQAGCKPADVWAFGTGPGNMIMDAMLQQKPDQPEPFDRDGKIAAAGTVHLDTVKKLLEHPYFFDPLPKTAGRELFRDFAEKIPAELSLEDRVATATTVTSLSIFQAFDRYVFPKTSIDEIIITGGGANNNTLVQFLKDQFKPVPIVRVDEMNIPAEITESVCFAVLANETLSGNPGNCPKATGAKKAVILGKICLP